MRRSGEEEEGEALTPEIGDVVAFAESGRGEVGRSRAQRLGGRVRGSVRRFCPLKPPTPLPPTS